MRLGTNMLAFGAIGRIAIAFVLSVIAISYFFDTAYVNAFANDIVLSFGIVIIFTFAPEAWAAMRAKPTTNVDALAFGIWCAWFATTCWRVVNVFGYRFNMSWLFNSRISSAIMTLSLMAGAAHIIAPTIRDGRATNKNWLTLGIVSGVSVAITLLIFRMTGGMPK